MSNLTHTKANIVIFLMVSFTALFWYWTLFPYNPLEVHGDLVVCNECKDICAGDNLVYEMTYTKNTNVKPVLQKTLVDGIIFHIANNTAYSEREIELGIKQTVKVTLPIPATAPAGEYYLNIDAVYRMNPIRDVVVSFKSEEFKIIDCL